MHSTLVPPWLRVLRAVTAADIFASGDHGGPPYLLEQRAGIGSLLDCSSSSGSGGGSSVGHRSWPSLASGRATNPPSVASRTS